MSHKQFSITNALTVDLEDWYHGLTRTMRTPERWNTLPPRAEISTHILLDLLAEADVKATFFVLGDLAAKSPSLIRQIAEAGHEIGNHGYSHRLIYEHTPEQFRDDLERSRQVIEDAAGRTVAGFRAPQFSISNRNLWALEVLAELGYKYDSSIFPVKSLFYGYPGAHREPYHPFPGNSFMEYPVATVTIGKIVLPIAGGIYNRILPYFFIRWALRKLNYQGVAAVLYLHPWELDLAQPRIPVSLRERLTHYGWRTTLLDKLRRLFRSFAFAPLERINESFQ
jgi:polysaccharide deacetylase family protein (PEP-CTERM system associated)